MMTDSQVLSTVNKKPIIALDCDGVLLDYQSTFPQIYAKTFGNQVTAVLPKAYHATTRYGVTFTSEERSQFDAMWDIDGWRTMPIHEGALEACHLLHAAGYELKVFNCTDFLSIDLFFVDDKKQNFKDIEGVQTKFIFIDHEFHDDPHRNENIDYDAKYPSLLEFVKDFLKDEVV